MDIISDVAEIVVQPIHVVSSNQLSLYPLEWYFELHVLQFIPINSCFKLMFLPSLKDIIEHDAPRGAACVATSQRTRLLNCTRCAPDSLVLHCKRRSGR